MELLEKLIDRLNEVEIKQQNISLEQIDVELIRMTSKNNHIDGKLIDFENDGKTFKIIEHNNEKL